MKMRTVLLLLTTVPAGTGMAAAYATGFEAGYNTNQQLAGQEGWTIDDPTPNLSFFALLNGSTAGALGGFNDAPAGAGMMLSHAASLPFAQSSFGVDFGVIPSTGAFPGTDSFGWTLASASSANLLTIQFEPDSIDPTLLNITWSTGAGSPVVTGSSISLNGAYRLVVNFTAAGSDIQFNAALTSLGTFTFNGTLPGLAGESIGSVAAGFTVNGASAGDNYMAFDNIAVVPEPAGSLLTLTAFAAALGGRRRTAGITGR